LISSTTYTSRHINGCEPWDRVVSQDAKKLPDHGSLQQNYMVVYSTGAYKGTDHGGIAKITDQLSVIIQGDGDIHQFIDFLPRFAYQEVRVRLDLTSGSSCMFHIQ
jgi:hypothetical protein